MIQKLILISLVLSCVSSSCVSARTYDCLLVPQKILEPTGYLNVERFNNSMCAFEIVRKAGKNFAMRTASLDLFPREQLMVMYNLFNLTSTILRAPIEPDYIVLSDQAVRITFLLNPILKSRMLLEFEQGDSINLDITRKTDLTFNSFYVESYSVAARSMPDMVTHLSDGFSHHLFEGTKLINVTKSSIQLKAAPVLANCSGQIHDATEVSHEISGPEAGLIKDAYTCVNLFTTTLKDPAHYDVDFSNFLDIVDVDDSLTIDDGSNLLIISRRNSKFFDQKKPIISFKGQNLAVIYDSPRVSQPRAVFKLTVRAQALGGIVEQNQVLPLPATGTVRYSFRPQSIETIGALEFKGSFAGADIRISNGLHESITLKSDMLLPPNIILGRAEDDIDVEFNVTSKVAGTVSYTQDPTCSGTLFKTVGSISVAGGQQQPCYWLIGSRSSINVNYCDLKPSGCLEIYNLKDKKPVFSSCNTDSCGISAPINVDASYLKITLPSNKTSVQVSISPIVATQSVVSENQTGQTNISSNNYPNSYISDDRSSTYPIDAKNKSMLLSIKDLDIRDGELVIVNTTILSSQNYSTFGDIDVSNKQFNLTLKRSGLSKDFGNHRGYFMSTTIYDSIISVDGSKQSSVKVPKNLTSLLMKISATQKDRLMYNISTSTSSGYSIQLYDAKSISGRQVYQDELLHGSTTSNVLYISLKTTKDKTTLPELSIDYKPVACNQTTDHICDQETRCVPEAKLCKGRSYCVDGSDLRVSCSSGPAPQPRIIDRGVSGVTVFFLSVLMFSLGIMAALFGPDMYRNMETRFRSGQYSTFTSTE